jgi:hypothetical protein
MLESDAVPILKRRATSPKEPQSGDSAAKRLKLEHGNETEANTASSDDISPTKIGEVYGSTAKDLPESPNPRQKVFPAAVARPEERTSAGTGPDRRLSVTQEEKRRGKRLFGGLISTLSQTTTNSHQKKRLEIERRQQERAHQQKIEDERRRADRLAQSNRARRIEHVKFDEEVVLRN